MAQTPPSDKETGSFALPLPPFFGVTSYWADPWLIVAGARLGRRHLWEGIPTDDAYTVTRCGNAVFLGIADGASDRRATRAAEGAVRALATAAATANSMIVADTSTSHSLVLAECLHRAHVDLASRATAQHIDANSYATTLSLVILDGDRISAAKVGDNSILLLDGPHLTSFCSSKLPPGGTPMITSHDWIKWQEVTTTDSKRSRAVVLCTDGAEDFFLSDSERKGTAPDTRVVDALMAHCDTHGPAAATLFAAQLLNDPSYAAATSDDRTFIIAFKPQSAEARPHARMSG